MYYYYVAIASTRYHKKEPLTYAFDSEIPAGSLVTVPLQKQTCLGFVLGPTPAPSFSTKSIFHHHANAGSVPAPLRQLLLWMLEYYPAPLGLTTSLFLPKDIPLKIRKPKPIISPSPISEPLPELTNEQLRAVKKMSTPGSFLLHGETGSGKTRVYLELALKTIANNKSCIVLTPEISLTSQLAQQFARIISPDRLFVIHSQLTNAARRSLWQRAAAATTPIIIIGPRSALFSPVQKVGLVVLDEFHEAAYKQENAPHYQTSRVAAKLANIHNATMVLGSATPSIIDYYYAEQKKRPIVRLSERAINAKNTTDVTTHIVDMRDRNNNNSHGSLSNKLVKEIENALQAKRQSILFLNRRGTARVVLCSGCGWQAVCPRCDLPLTYHHDTHVLRCHMCGYTEAARTSCPECGNSDIILKSVGTKALMTTLEKKFPTATIARFDADSAAGERIHELYEKIHAGKIDILVGTQLLAKGLDLPKLGLVGVINADASLYVPDFSAQERTYQLLYQLIGRVGRGHQAGVVVVQTYSPENPAITTAINRDWTTFYKNELAERHEFMFPPYCHMLKASCRRATSASAQKNAERIAAVLQKNHRGVAIEGPAPSFHEKIQSKYVWQLILKSKDRAKLLACIKDLPPDWSYDIDPIDLL